MTEIEFFTSFKRFYPYYLKEHRNKTCRRLHFIGSSLVLLLTGYALINSQFVLL